MRVTVDADAIQHRLPFAKFQLLLPPHVRHMSNVHHAVKVTLLPIVNATLPRKRIVVAAKPANAKVVEEVEESLS